MSKQYTTALLYYYISISFYGYICPAMRNIDLTYFLLYLNKFGENCKRQTQSANHTLKRNYEYFLAK